MESANGEEREGTTDEVRPERDAESGAEADVDEAFWAAAGAGSPEAAAEDDDERDPGGSADAGEGGEEPGESGDSGESRESRRDTEEAGERESDEERLTEEIREELQELDELRDRHLRLAAEFDNYRKRTRRQMVEERKRAQADLAREILEVLDDLARVGASDPESTSLEALHEGVEMVERKFRKKLRDAGVHRIEAAGQAFDPELHEALTSIPTEDPDEDGVVAQVITEGYRHGDRLLRPAQVAVKQLKD